METAAQRLKALRLEKGFSLEEVQKKTRVQMNILRALEGDSLTTLSPVYLQGFLKIYCKFLGVDPKDFSADSKETKQRKEPEAVVKKIAQSGPAVSSSEKPEPQVKKATFAPEPEKVPAFFRSASLKLGSIQPPKNLKKIIVSILIIVVFCFILFKIGKAISRHNSIRLAQQKVAVPLKVASKKTQKETTPAKTLTKAAASATTTHSTVIKESNAAVVKKADTSEIRMVIKAKENCWVTLKVDGKLVFRRVLEKGRSDSWKAKERIDLSLGNAGAVELEVDGQLFTNLGKKGQPLKNIVVTKKGLEIAR